MKTCPLILPPEFHPRDQKRRYEFRKELSDQWTLSFSHGQAARRAHHAHKSTNSVSKKNNRKTVTSNPKLVKHKYSNKRMAWSMDKDNTIVLEEDKNMTNEVDNHQNTDNDVDIAHLNGLVHELQTILSSDFMAKSVEDEIIEKVYMDIEDTRWRNHFSSYVVSSILHDGEATKLLYDNFEKIQNNKRGRYLIKCFDAWKNVTPRSVKQDVIKSKDRVDATYYWSKKKNILNVISALSVGASSKKKILERRSDGLSHARSTLVNKLSKTNEQEGLITSNMVQMELQRMFYAELFDWNRKRYLSRCFKSWYERISFKMSSTQKARKFYTRKVFDRWKVWTMKQIVIIQGDSNNSPYSYIEAETFHCKRIKFHSFKAWRKKAHLYLQAKRMQRKFVTNHISKCINEWNQQIRYYREIKMNALVQWKEYKHIMIGHPFECWKKIAKTQMQQRRERDRCISYFTRIKRRRIIWHIFKKWRQQALYGRVTGMYTRQELIEQLAIQTRRIETILEK